MKYLGTIALGLVLVLVSSSSTAYALGAEADTVTDIDANVSGNAEATESISSEVEVSGSGSAGAAESASGTAGASGNVSAQTDVSAGTEILITRADVNAGSVVQTAVSAPNAVQSQADLSAYASSVIRADSDADNAQLSGTAVSLDYKERIRLFGFIPILVRATATVNANGDTTVSYPWYAMFATTDSATLRSEVRAATSDVISSNAGASFSAATQAELLSRIQSAMKTHLQASLAAETQTSASVQ
ncbi:MAG: hypothetical protein NUV59_04360 [Patescibacteria group bacterium]|nr:hypothetical protein [Patescibacteria group bacterium]